MGVVNTTSAAELRVHLDELKATAPALRARDAATALGVSEAALLALDCGAGVTRLHADDWGGLVGRLHELGRCMALTRNDHCVIEKDGVYEHFEARGHAAQVVGPDIDLRIFFSRWALGYAAVATHHDRVQRSLQFFDAHGTAVHKVFLRGTERVAAFDALVAAFRHADQDPDQEVAPRAEPVALPATRAVDLEAFQRHWLAMTDTHEFFGLLRRHGLTRTRALGLAPEGMAEQVASESAVHLLEHAAGSALPLMIFVGNPGVIQIVTGPIHRVQRSHGYFNVLDDGFNLHLRDSAIAEAWVVRKPTTDGLVTSLELYDRAGETIALCFGTRKPGMAESEEWRALLARATA
jgi:putative hemin transport protein